MYGLQQRACKLHITSIKDELKHINKELKNISLELKKGRPFVSLAICILNSKL